MRRIIFLSIFLICVSCTAALNGSPIQEIGDLAPSKKYIRNNAISLISPSTLDKKIWELIAHKRLFLVGEIHGTNEAPEFVLGLLRLLKQHEINLSLALEIPQNEQKAIDHFMATGQEIFLRKSPFFNRDVQDGRSSEAIVGLLQEVRRLKPVKVYCFDVILSTSSQDRDTEMARNVLRYIKTHPRDVILALAGNIHTQITSGTPFDPDYRPMGYELLEMAQDFIEEEDVLSLKFRFFKGTSWLCLGAEDCGIKNLGPVYDNFVLGTEYKHYFLPQKEIHEGHNGTVFTRFITHSEPFIWP